MNTDIDGYSETGRQLSPATGVLCCRALRRRKKKSQLSIGREAPL